LAAVYKLLCNHIYRFLVSEQTYTVNTYSAREVCGLIQVVSLLVDALNLSKVLSRASWAQS